MGDKLEVLVVPVADADRANGRHEEQIGPADPDWPDWYAQYMVDEQAGSAGQARPGAST